MRCESLLRRMSEKTESSISSTSVSISVATSSYASTTRSHTEYSTAYGP